ncbi:MAG: LamG-like jellyroll fold domain-containing protein, partial [Verrucomicrobiota bacterium]
VPFGRFTHLVSAHQQTLAGLQPSEQVFFSWRASNCASVVWSETPRSFLTLGPPEVENGNGASVGIGEASLEAELVRGQPADVLFYWGTSDGGTNPAGWGNVVVLAGQNHGTHILSVSNLLFGQTYYYRTFATNALGVDWATNTVAFATINPLIHALKINLCGYARPSRLTNFPLLVELSTNLPGFSYEDFVRNDGYDLRLWASDRITPLNFEIDTWDINGASTVWVQIPDVIDSNTCIWATWGDASAASIPTSASDCSTWSEGYVGVWHLGDDADSGLFPDSVSSNDAMDNGASDTTTTAGPIGDAQDFDGGVDELIVANESNFDFVNQMSVSAWFRVEAFDRRWQALVAKGEGLNWRLHRFQESDRLNMVANSGVSAGVGVDDGQWHHILATKSQTDGISIYIDGMLAGNNPMATNAMVPDDNPVIIGENPGAQSREWNGDIDEVRISSIPRSADWTWASWSNQVPGNAFNCFKTVSEMAISNRPVTSITSNSAVLNASFNSSGAVYTVWVYWGPSEGGTNAATWSNAIEVGTFTNVTTNFSVPVGGLGPGPYVSTWRATNTLADVWARPSVSWFVPGGPVDLALDKTVNPTNLSVGTGLVYTITVSNVSAAEAFGVVVTDALPAEVLFESASPTPDRLTSNLLAFELGRLAPGVSTSIVINAGVRSSAVNTLTNRATVYLAGLDTNLANNTDSAETTLSDADSDGHPDFVDPDDDNDGVSDESESIAGTDPFDESSFLRLQIDRTPTQMVQALSFFSVSNRTYFIQCRTNLLAGPWVTIRTNIPGSGEFLAIPQTNQTLEKKYFRIGVTSP